MQLFYNPTLKPHDINFCFDKNESRHIVKVLRKKIGDKLIITNGLGYFFEADILFNKPSKCEVKITKVTPVTAKEYNIHLAVAPTKTNDRYEWFLEKATEIGVDTITPIICSRSERKVIKRTVRKNFTICCKTIPTRLFSNFKSCYSFFRICKKC